MSYEVIVHNLKNDIKDKRETNMNIWWILLVVAIWFALQAFILPKLGIST